MQLDARGKACPMPVVLAIKELEKMNDGEVLEVLVDNDAAVGNLTRMAIGKGASAESVKTGDDWRVSIVKGGTQGAVGTADAGAPAGAAGTDAADCGCAPMYVKDKGSLVIAVGADHMGEGDEKLGKILMKSYLFSLTQQEEFPAQLIFFNGGVKLTTEGSESLKDIQELSERGVEVFSCGTCLDFYGLKEKLQVGSITNMYAIAEAMQNADRLVRL